MPPSSARAFFFLGFFSASAALLRTSPASPVTALSAARSFFGSFTFDMLTRTKYLPFSSRPMKSTLPPCALTVFLILASFARAPAAPGATRNQ